MDVHWVNDLTLIYSQNDILIFNGHLKLPPRFESRENSITKRFCLRKSQRQGRSYYVSQVKYVFRFLRKSNFYCNSKGHPLPT